MISEETRRRRQLNSVTAIKSEATGSPQESLLACKIIDSTGLRDVCTIYMEGPTAPRKIKRRRPMQQDLAS